MTQNAFYYTITIVEKVIKMTLLKKYKKNTFDNNIAKELIKDDIKICKLKLSNAKTHIVDGLSIIPTTGPLIGSLTTIGGTIAYFFTENIWTLILGAGALIAESLHAEIVFAYEDKLEEKTNFNGCITAQEMREDIRKKNNEKIKAIKAKWEQEEQSNIK